MERWRPVVGLEGRYEVSDLGRVRNVERVAWRRRGYGPTPGQLYASRCSAKIRALHTTDDGYQQVKLADRGSVRVHVLVLESFVGPCPPGKEGCHDDGDPGNNQLGNLRWDTHQANGVDMIRHGRSPRGERQGAHKLTTASVIAIRARASDDPHALALEFGTQAPNIRRVQRGQTWKDTPC